MPNANDLVFSVNAALLTLSACPAALSAGSMDANTCFFTFDSAWSGYNPHGRIACFGADRDRLVPTLLARMNTSDTYYCTIPREALAQLGSGGELYISLRAYHTQSGAILSTKLYAIQLADSGEAEVYITPSERQQFLNEAQQNIAALSARAIEDMGLNDIDELVITLADETEYNLGCVRGPTGEQGRQGATGAAGNDGVGIASITKNADNELVITLTNGTVLNLGNIKGDTGATGAQGPQGQTGSTGATGANGKSAYALAVDAGFSGTEAQWLASLKQGKSAYEVAVENGYSGTEVQWLASLKGETGAQGPTGPQGAQGTQGHSVTGFSIRNDGQYVFTLSNGQSYLVSAPTFSVDAGAGSTVSKTNPQWIQYFYDALESAAASVSAIEGVIGS